MAKRKYSRPRRRWFRRRSRGKRKIPLAIVLGLAGTALGGKGGKSTLQHLQDGELASALYRTTMNFTGFDMATGIWDYHYLNLEPLIIGALVHKACGLLGINRTMAKVPLINI